MTDDEKLCPFMSRAVYAGEFGERPVYQNGIIECQKERCMAWGEIKTGNGLGCRLIP